MYVSEGSRGLAEAAFPFMRSSVWLERPRLRGRSWVQILPYEVPEQEKFHLIILLIITF